MTLMEKGLKSNNPANANLIKAKKAKNDEFYTRYEDIEAEVMEYKEQFQDKIVYLPCDSLNSEFWSFFINNFQSFGLKKLIATHYEKDGQSYKVWTNDGNNIIQEDLVGDGDFRSQECIEILKECDIVCTNPPFSLFREFVNVIMTHGKQCLIIGNKNALTYKEIISLIKKNKIWIGYTQPKDFRLEDGSITKKINGLARWFTNLTVNKSNDELVLTKTYNAIDYQKYDNYDAIEVSKVVNIPKDYDGIMGVPITFLDKYNPDQFEILGWFKGFKECDLENGFICGEMTEYIDSKTHAIERWNGPTINKKAKYTRILIRRKK